MIDGTRIVGEIEAVGIIPGDRFVFVSVPVQREVRRVPNAPLVLTAPAQAFDWQPSDAQALPDKPVTGTPATIRLVPYGCTKFRISMFPVTPASDR